MFQMEPDVYRKRRKRCALDGAIWDERLKPESHADLAWAQGKVATKGKAKAGNGATKGKAKAGNGAAKGKANARDYSGKSAAASADAASPDPAKGKPRRTPSLIREHTYERAMFEAACFERYGVKVWARVILAGGTIHRTHIHAVNTEIKMRIREGEGRDATEIDTELHPAVGSRNVGRIGIPPVESADECWGWHTNPETGRPSTLLHVAMKVYVENGDSGALFSNGPRR